MSHHASLTLILLTALAWAGEAPSAAPWAQAPKAAGYATAFAHAPAFQDKALWPISGQEAYAQQRIPQGRLLIWRETGGGAKAGPNPREAKSWTDAATGQPATEPVDERTDLLLPDAEQPYLVSWKVKGQEHAPITIRSLTIGRNAQWSSSGVALTGNLWIRAGGKMGNHGNTRLVGSVATFMRNDNGDAAVNQSPGSHISQYQYVDKDGASVEMVGNFSYTDEFRVMKGLLVIGPDSRVQPGRNATPTVAKGAALALMDGCWFGKWINQFETLELDCAGAVTGGLPERPLRRSAFWGLSFKNWNGTKIPVPAGSEQDKEWNTRIPGVLLRSGASIAVHSADPAKVRLVIGWHGLTTTYALYDEANPKKAKAQTDPAVMAAYKAIPPQIDLYLEKGASISGVELRDLHPGGLILADDSLRAACRDLAFGPGSAPQAEAFSVLAIKGIKL